MEHAQALLGDLDRRRHEVVRAEDVECAKRSAGVRNLVEVANAAPGTLAVGAAGSKATRDARLAVAAVIRVAADRMLRIEPQRKKSSASPPHRQARRNTAGVGRLSGGDTAAVWAGSVEGECSIRRKEKGEGSGCERSKRARLGVDEGVAGGGPVMSSPREGNRQ